MLRQIKQRLISLKKNQESQKIIFNTGWLLANHILKMGVNLIVGVWLARYLGTESYGILSYATALVYIFTGLADFGLNSIVVRDILKNPNDKDEILGTAFILRICASIIALTLIIGTVVYLNPKNQLTQTIVIIIALTLLFKSSEIIKYWFELKIQSKYVIQIESLALFSVSIINILFIVYQAPLIFFAISILLESALVSIGLFKVYVDQNNSWRVWFFKLARAKKLINDSWPFILSSLSTALYMNVDQIMIGKMLDNHDVGIYTAAVKLSEVWYFIPVSINISLRPKLIKLHKVSPKKFLLNLQKIFNLMVWMAFPISLFVTFFSEPIIQYSFGDNYAMSSKILVVHIWASIFVFFNNTAWIWFLVENKQILGNVRLIYGLIINIILNYLWIPKFGPLGAAYATLVSRGFIVYLGQLLTPDTRILFLMMTRSILGIGCWR